MKMNQIIKCPNCGSQAERRYFTSNEAIYNSCPNHHVVQTECPVCDYLMVMCSRNARIIEAHAPSTSNDGATSYFRSKIFSKFAFREVMRLMRSPIYLKN